MGYNYKPTLKWALLTAAVVGALAALLPGHAQAADAPAKVELLNVSYDPTRELYEALNPVFAKQWKDKTGQDVVIKQSHGGSGKQARAVIDGLQADVVTLALGYDIDAIAKAGGRVKAGWQSHLPHNSSPYTSTIVFLVRKGNPKNIKDWGDLTQQGLQIITPNPKTSGGARWNYLAAWAWASEKFGGDETKIQDYIAQVFRNVPILDTGARGSTTTFVQRGIGDVLLAWENEAFLAINELGKDKFEIVVPSLSILAEPPVTIVDKVVDRRNTREVSEAYLNFLYTPEAQKIIAQNYYRPIDPAIAAQYKSQFPTVRLVTIDHDFGGWDKAQKKHFDDGGTFDTIYKQSRQ